MKNSIALVALSALLLVASACGDSDDDSGESEVSTPKAGAAGTSAGAAGAGQAGQSGGKAGTGAGQGGAGQAGANSAGSGALAGEAGQAGKGGEAGAGGSAGPGGQGGAGASAGQAGGSGQGGAGGLAGDGGSAGSAGQAGQSGSGGAGEAGASGQGGEAGQGGAGQGGAAAGQAGAAGDGGKAGEAGAGGQAGEAGAGGQAGEAGASGGAGAAGSEGCVISGAHYEPGEADPSSDCRFCDPEVSTTSWSPRPAWTQCIFGVCDGEGICGDCFPGETRCSGNTVQVCQKGGAVWANKEFCSGATPVCGPGKCVECEEAADCPPPGECRVAACASNTCQTTDKPSGTVVASQTGGDCKKYVCDGQGDITTVKDDTDLPADDENPCTDAVCVNGKPLQSPKPDGTSCNGTMTCKGGLCGAD